MARCWEAGNLWMNFSLNARNVSAQNARMVRGKCAERPQAQATPCGRQGICGKGSFDQLDALMTTDNPSFTNGMDEIDAENLSQVSTL
jgi:hypothetical protein